MIRSMIVSAGAGGMLVGPNDPMFRDPLADPRFPSSLPPGARFDPIGKPFAFGAAAEQDFWPLCCLRTTVVAVLSLHSVLPHLTFRGISPAHTATFAGQVLYIRIYSCCVSECCEQEHQLPVCMQLLLGYLAHIQTISLVWVHLEKMAGMILGHHLVDSLEEEGECPGAEGVAGLAVQVDLAAEASFSTLYGGFIGNSL